MGPKFAVIFSGVELNGVVDFLNDSKEIIEKFNISLEASDDDDNKKKRKKKPMMVSPRLNFALSTYYKGTGLEEVLKKLENYIDNASLGESDINNI